MEIKLIFDDGTVIDFDDLSDAERYARFQAVNGNVPEMTIDGEIYEDFEMWKSYNLIL